MTPTIAPTLTAVSPLRRLNTRHHDRHLARRSDRSAIRGTSTSFISVTKSHRLPQKNLYKGQLAKLVEAIIRRCRHSASLIAILVSLPLVSCKSRAMKVSSALLERRTSRVFRHILKVDLRMYGPTPPSSFDICTIYITDTVAYNAPRRCAGLPDAIG